MIARLLRGATFVLLAVYLLLLALVFNHRRIPFPKPGNSAQQTKTDVRALADSLHPHLAELAKLPYFRYYRVNLNQKCAFGLDGNVCQTPTTCQLLSPGQNSSLPAAFLEEDRRLLASNAQFSNYELFEFVKPFYDAGRHDWSFDPMLPDNVYVDLVADREQYTGYQGQEIWRKIYRENCLGFSERCNNSQLLYRLVSGMHTSVSSQLCEHFVDWRGNASYPNAQLYQQKVAGEPARLANLLFAWEVLAQAFLRYYDVISRMPLKTQQLRSDARTPAQLGRVWEILADYPEAEFPCGDFAPGQPDARGVFLRYFTNITRLMDCVECLTCKVYGKLQIMGMGTALRVLLNPEPHELTRNELVALVNTFSKWTESIVILRRMQRRSAARRWKQALLLSAIFCLLNIPLLFALQQIRKRKLKRL